MHHEGRRGWQRGTVLQAREMQAWFRRPAGLGMRPAGGRGAADGGAGADVPVHSGLGLGGAAGRGADGAGAVAGDPGNLVAAPASGRNMKGDRKNEAANGVYPSAEVPGRHGALDGVPADKVTCPCCVNDCLFIAL